MKAIVNDAPIEIQPKKPKHPGFVDAHGQELAPGDEIIVTDHYRSYHAVITRFTPRRIYWRVLTFTTNLSDYFKTMECSTQLHYWYSTGGHAAGMGSSRTTDPEPKNMFRKVIRLGGSK